VPIATQDRRHGGRLPAPRHCVGTKLQHFTAARRRGRLALTLVTLTLGVALFVSVASMQSSLDATLDDVLRYSDYDVQLTLGDSVPVADAIRDAEAIEGVERPDGGSRPTRPACGPTARRTPISG
jgi:hypothetical protein